MPDVVCAIDLGTSVIKACLVDDRGTTVSSARVAAPALSGDEMTFDAASYFDSTCKAVVEAVRGHSDSVRGIALSTQRSTVVCEDEGEGGALAWSWQGIACEEAGKKLYDRIGRARFRAITGLVPSALYAFATIAHLRAHHPDVCRSTRRFVGLHDYVLRRLGTSECMTDGSNASTTGLMDTRERKWSPELLEVLELTEDQLSIIRSAGTRAGSLRKGPALGLPSGIPLFVGGGDQQCAVLGAGAVEEGTCLLSTGTAAVVMCPIDHPADPSVGGILCTAHLRDDQWILEGFHPSFGSAFQWAGGLLGTSGFDELERLALAAEAGAAGLRFLPFLAGIGSPDFDGAPRGVLLGASLEHDRSALARSVFEGVTMEVRRIIDHVGRCVPLRRLVVVGGGVSGELVQQRLADITGFEVETLGVSEAAVLGAACVAWTGLGRFTDLAQASRSMVRGVDARYEPRLGRSEAEAEYAAYCRAVDCIRSFARQELEG